MTLVEEALSQQVPVHRPDRQRADWMYGELVAAASPMWSPTRRPPTTLAATSPPACRWRAAARAAQADPEE